MDEKAGNYVAYLRKSRADMDAERRGEGETLARHESALRELAARLRLNLTAFYREIVSGDTIAARPVMRRLLAEVEAGAWDGVLVMEVERLARGDTIDQGVVAEAFRLSGTKIVTPSKTYEPANEADEEYFEFGLFMSRREYKAINRRLQRGRAASVREGKYVGSVPPYGYARRKLPDEKGYILIPNPDEAPAVRLIFTLYAHGEQTPDGAERPGIAEITRRLNALRIPTRRGGAWSAGTVREILRNPVYMGKLRWNWRKVKKRREGGHTADSRPRSGESLVLAAGRHEALIPPETFEAARERMTGKRTPSTRGARTLQNPLAGLIVCGKCGRRMQRRPYKEGGAALICPNPDCDNVSADLSTVEARIIAALRPWLDGWRLSGTENAGVQDERAFRAVRRQAAARLEREIAALETQRDNLRDLLERGLYDAETFQERGRVIAERLERAKRDRAALDDAETESSVVREAGKETRAALDDAETESSVAREAGEKTRVTRDASNDAGEGTRIIRDAPILDGYETLTPVAKNGTLKAVLEKAVYQKDADCRRICPDGFTLNLFPKLPRMAKR